MYKVWRERGISHLEFYRRAMAHSWGQLLDLAAYPRACYGVAEDAAGVRRGIIVRHAWDPCHYATHNYRFQLWREQDLLPMGGLLDQAPMRILDQLSPLSDCGYTEAQLEYARRWREHSRTWQLAQQAKPRPKKGQLVIFEQPYWLERSGLVQVDTFEFLGRSSFRIYGDPSDTTWQLVSWRRRDYRVEDQEHRPAGGALGELLG